jgi:hypothetical protein
MLVAGARGAPRAVAPDVEEADADRHQHGMCEADEQQPGLAGHRAEAAAPRRGPDRGEPQQEREADEQLELREPGERGGQAGGVRP